MALRAHCSHQLILPFDAYGKKELYCFKLKQREDAWFIGLLQLSVVNRVDERTWISQSNCKTILPARLI